MIKANEISKAVSMIKNRKIKMGILVAMDFLMIIFSYFLAYIFRFYIAKYFFAEVMSYYIGNFNKVILAAVIYVAFFTLYKQYRSIWILAGVEELTNGTAAAATGCAVNLIISLAIPHRIPLMVTVLAGFFVIIFTNTIRISLRLIRRIIVFAERVAYKDFTRVLVIGAGAAGALVVGELNNRVELKKKVVGIIDDNKQKLGTYVCGIKVRGTRNDIKEIVEKEEVDEIIIAIANIRNKPLKNIINICKDLKVKVRIMPGLNEMIDGKFSVEKIREVSPEDLLGRETIKLDFEGISDYLEEKVVLVTGGGGSIGSELCRQIIRFKPKQLIIFDIYENNAYDIQMELKRNYPELNLVTLIGSVRDKERLDQVFSKYHPNVVFHAAAHKHVPLMEDSPAEAIKNNVAGTLNVAETADKYQVERFVLISTDKAVNPTNVMGASKRLCEMIIQAINEKSDTEYVAVRFGNVLGSNGSVIPLFKKQIEKGGPVTLTHKDIIRYFMTIPEAAQLVLQAGALAKGGEIFVLDMGKPVKIYDLAKNLIKLSGFEPEKDIKIEVTGLRPGEKLYEELLMSEEGLENTGHKKIFVGKPRHFELAKIKKSIKKLMDVGSHESIEELKNVIGEVVPTYQNINKKIPVLKNGIVNGEEIAVTASNEVKN